MKIRYAKNLKTGSIETQGTGTEGNQADLDVMRSNMIGDGSNGLTPADVEVGWEEEETISEWENSFNNSLMTYSDHRATAYASIPDQLDYIYHNGVEKWKTDMVLPVKEKYPKGDS
jgi:hypothetical protein